MGNPCELDEQEKGLVAGGVGCCVVFMVPITVELCILAARYNPLGITDMVLSVEEKAGKIISDNLTCILNNNESFIDRLKTCMLSNF